ncbi:di-heme oxidoredictase family protein [Arcicella sp. LKC2W]|uniref:di-heme oxidoreductase family protein n=1 Tax=Arcicella sp. LKC2W TaxID=2984198 RepID=UPI002B1FAF6F|nr:di-heme oxidoredictase family protein [Arcicella sp. LKC2W]MEA5461465.1 di-heme oxidoredictase family protein [Arcicella sp. LKC2W]
MNKLIIIGGITLCLVSIYACKNNSDPITPQETDEEFSGGREGTVFDETFNAFGNPLINLTSDETDKFVIGNSFNRNNWVIAPSSTAARDGLGPLLNAASCASCHALDGKGNPFQSDGVSLSQAMLFRLSVQGQGIHGEPKDDPHYGGQFNPRSIPNVDVEGEVSVTYEEIAGKYPDGTTYSLRKPTYKFTNLNYGTLNGTMISPRIAPSMIGMGLLDAVSEKTILANADENDANGDGISGRANYVWDEKNKKKSIGKLGWKANQPNVEQQTAGAFNGDIGITSNLFPKEGLTDFQQQKYGSLPKGGTPEIDETTLQKVVFYIKALAVPARRNWKDADVLTGKQLFIKANCSGCHLLKMETSDYDSPKYVAKQIIRPYSDLLLHDMGKDLADNRPDFEATGVEWRTAPLWGIGLQKTVNKHTYMLHDGRARNVEEAILWHGGEAMNAKNAYMKLSKTERESVLKFIDSL